MRSDKLTLPQYFSSSVGKKYLMAASGLVLSLFVIGHLVGNLQIFLGAEAINRYGELLKSFPELLWPVRIFLLAMILLHIATSTQLTLEARAARPVAYSEKTYTKASLASRTMFISGLLIFSFVIYHLLHFTFLRVHPEYSNLIDMKGRHDVYSMMVRSFQQPGISAAYIVAMFCLCFHLSHGLSSMFQSLGFNSERSRPCLSQAGAAVAWAIFLGYISIPVACLMGWVNLP